MKRSIPFIMLLLTLGPGLFGQSHGDMDASSSDFTLWFSLLEIPFLILVVALSFIVASALKGGKFGKGMSFIAWGFLIMAIGHIHMQLHHLTGFNLFEELLGEEGGSIAWFAALLATWTLSGIGFYTLFKASRL